jgi:hypothetical protein
MPFQARSRRQGRGYSGGGAERQARIAGRGVYVRMAAPPVRGEWRRPDRRIRAQFERPGRPGPAKAEPLLSATGFAMGFAMGGWGWPAPRCLSANACHGPSIQSRAHGATTLIPDAEYRSTCRGSIRLRAVSPGSGKIVAHARTRLHGAPLLTGIHGLRDVRAAGSLIGLPARRTPANQPLGSLHQGRRRMVAEQSSAGFRPA